MDPSPVPTSIEVEIDPQPTPVLPGPITLTPGATVGMIICLLVASGSLLAAFRLDKWRDVLIAIGAFTLAIVGMLLLGHFGAI